MNALEQEIERQLHMVLESLRPEFQQRGLEPKVRTPRRWHDKKGRYNSEYVIDFFRNNNLEDLVEWSVYSSGRPLIEQASEFENWFRESLKDVLASHPSLPRE